MSPLLHNRNKLIPKGVLSVAMLVGLPRDSCVVALGRAANNNAAQPTSANNAGAAIVRIRERAEEAAVKLVVGYGWPGCVVVGLNCILFSPLK